MKQKKGRVNRMIEKEGGREKMKRRRGDTNRRRRGAEKKICRENQRKSGREKAKRERVQKKRRNEGRRGGDKSGKLGDEDIWRRKEERAERWQNEWKKRKAED